MRKFILMNQEMLLMHPNKGKKGKKAKEEANKPVYVAGN